MATTSRSGVGGKVVAKRREQRLATTPYDRPTKNPSWLTRIVLPSARRLASGAGKIINSILSESESSSSESDSDASDGDLDDSLPLSNALSEKNAVASQNMHGIQTKQLIETLIGQETFSREEFDRLTSALKSRVVGCSLESGERYMFSSSPANAFAHDHGDLHDKAIQEAKRWFQDKKEGASTPATKLGSGDIACSTSSIDHAGHGEGSPMDVARSYMKERAPWASPTKRSELQTPLATIKKFFDEDPPRTVGYDSFSSSKNMRRSYLSSGSWNIEEEKRKVRSKAIDDLLRASSYKADPSSFSVALPRESFGNGKASLISGQGLVQHESIKQTHPISALLDARTRAGPSLSALESRQDDTANGLFPSGAASQSKDQEAVGAEAECAAAKLMRSHSPSFAEENHTDALSFKIDEPTTESAANPNTTNGFSTYMSSMPADVDATQNSQEHELNNNAPYPSNENRPSSTPNLEGDSVLNETNMEEVPVVMEAVMGFEDSLGVRHESLPLPILPSKPKSRRSSKQTSSRPGRGK